MTEKSIEYMPENNVFKIGKTMNMNVLVPKEEFGDAITEDVAVGKTFTSSNGLKLTGTMNIGNVHTATITIPRGRMKGDINNDGVVDEKDKAIINKYISSGAQYPFDEESRQAADIDGSGGVTANDGNYMELPCVKKYKVSFKSIDFIGPWEMRKEFIAESTGDYEWIFSTDITVEGVTPTSTVKVTPKNFAEVTRCGMNSEITLGEGCITFHTLRPPRENIECMIEFFESGDGSAVFVVLPTEIEIEDTTAKNLFDGSSDGSLRTKGSKEEFDNGGDKESDYYFMGEYAFAEGCETLARGYYTHAEGYKTVAIGTSSHAEGQSSCANGNYCHAEGNGTKANGYSSHSEGHGTIASGIHQHVHGRYNVEDIENKYVDIVGNGTANNRSNAYTLDWNGNGAFAGKVIAGVSPTNDMDLTTKQYVDNAIVEAINALRQQLGY